MTPEQEAKAQQNYNEFLRQWWFGVAVMVTITATSFLSNDWIDRLALIPEAVSDGQWWRLLTSQFVHLGFSHTSMNLMGYLIIGVAFREDIRPWQEARILAISVLGVGLGLYWFSADIQWYVGLSGAIYGLLAAYLLLGWRRSPALSLLFGFFLISKLVYEQGFAGPDTVSADLIGGPVAIDAHLYGALTGLVAFGFELWLKRRRAPVHGSEPTG